VTKPKKGSMTSRSWGVKTKEKSLCKNIKIKNKNKKYFKNKIKNILKIK